MLFELRNSTPTVSDTWIAARALFLEGKSADAWSEIQAVMRREPNTRLQTANDYLLHIEIMRASGIYKRYLALVRLAHKHFPSDPFIQLYYSRMLQTRGRHVQGIEYLLGLEDTLGKTHRGLWGTQLANIYADAGFGTSSKNWISKVQNEPLFDSPNALYSRACAADGVRNWDRAIELAQQCVDSAPQWTRARVHLVNCLLARGKVDEAKKNYDIVRELGHQESYIDFSSAMLHCAEGDLIRAADELQQCVDTWSEAEFRPWAVRMLYVLHVEAGRFEKAAEVAESVTANSKEEFGLPSIDEIEHDRPHKYIPIPLVAQNTSQCVPTTVAMSAYPQGRRLNPDQLYKEMHGRDGTPLWRMRDWVQNHGLTFVPIKLQIETIIKMLDQGIPLIGILEGPFSSHVDVICGYHDGLKVFYIRDPGHWSPIIVPYEAALKRYEIHDGVLAVVENENTTAIQCATDHRSDDLTAFLDLQQHTAQGNRVGAEEAAARIPDDSILAFMRDRWGFNVTIENERFNERMTAYAKDPETNKILRLRALMSLGIDEADPIYEQVLNDEDNYLGNFGQLYVEMTREHRKSNWKEAFAKLERLLIRGCTISDLWVTRSDLLGEFGRHEESKRALELALELSPENLFLRERALGQQINYLTYDKYESEIESMISDYPQEKRILWGRVNVRRDGPDGLSFEEAIRDHLRWFPRDYRGYQQLAYWYSMQGREDLADGVMDEAHVLMPERKPESETEEKETQEESQEEQQTTDELPTNHRQLLDIVWDREHAQRKVAYEVVQQAFSDGKLTWGHHSEFATFLVTTGLEDKPLSPDEAEKILPAPTPGPTYWYVNGVLESVSRMNLSYDTAKVIVNWQEKVAPDYRKYSNLWFNRIVTLEHTGAKEKALVELQELLEAFPAFSSALYRMGVLKNDQGDLSTSAKYFERALEVNPGLYGAMSMLCEIYNEHGNQTEALENYQRLSAKMPYSYAILRDELYYLADVEGESKAFQRLEELKPRYAPLFYSATKARLASKVGNLDLAGQLVDELSKQKDQMDPKRDEDLFEEYLQARMSVAIKQEDAQQVDDACAEGLALWPDSTRLKLLRAEYGTADKETLLREVLVSGEADPQTAFGYLVAVERDPLDHIKSIVQDANADKRQDILELFSQVTGFSELLHHNYDFLQWATEQYPDSSILKYRLASHCQMSGMHRDAIELARQLHDSEPNNVELIRFYGRTLLDEDPGKALTYLKRACDQNCSIDYLFDLASCYLALGKADKSRDTHYEILKQNPYVGASVTNLFVQEESPERLWPYAKEIVKRRSGVDDEYFLVAAVKLALSQGAQVPSEWYELAEERLQILQTRPGYADEKPLLEKAVSVWKKMRPSNGKPAGFFQRQILAFSWPGTKWVPRNDGSGVA